jgi:AAA family ATP:ADP antiporter
VTIGSSEIETGPVGQALARVVHVLRGEVAPLLLSFATFFLVLSAYYVIRPVRDEMGVALGRDALERLFTVVFLVMLAAVPLYGWIVSSVPRRLIVPCVYLFFVVNLVLFRLAGGDGQPGPWLAGTFFVWASVFNLFIVSLFWITMSDLWASAQAKRLYGFIAAGGSAGALTGPFLTQALVGVLGASNMLLVSATLLAGAMLTAIALRRHVVAGGGAGTAEEELPVGRNILAGAVRVWESPYLFRIALWVLLANVVSTFFYLEQSRIVGETLTDRTARVTLFARIDLAVSVLTILAQVLVTGRLIERLGVGLAAAAAPAWATLGLVALAISPTLAVIVTVLAIERAIGFAFSNPAARVLYTVVDREEKYKAQSFVDTVVFRGGDAAAGWLFGSLARGAGLGVTTVAALTLPLAAVWVWLSLGLGKRQEDLAKA